MADTWINLSQDDVLASINNAELTAAISTAIAQGQVSPLTVLMPDVIQEVRGYVRRRNTLGPDGAIPAELKNAAIDIIIYRCACRVNKAADAKKPMNDIALQKLAAVAKGDLRVSAPDCPTTESTQAEGPAMPTHVRREFGWDQERGI
jgi:phage gp36-like protein